MSTEPKKKGSAGLLNVKWFFPWMHGRNIFNIRGAKKGSVQTVRNDSDSS